MKKILLSVFTVLLLHPVTNAQLNLQWQDLGPDNLGASIRGLILDNRDSTRQTLYAGVMGGGVWKTTDGGAWWTYLGCTGNYAISCITQSSNGTIYIGTGDGFDYYFGYNTVEGHVGNGIYKLDSADNFIHLDSTTALNNSGPWSAVNRIAVDPTSPNNIIAATITGLYKSIDAGNSWNIITIQGLGMNSTLDIKWSSNGLNIYADYGTAIIRSVDGGATWKALNSVLNTGFPTGALGRAEIAISPSNSNVAYLSIASTQGSFKGIYKTSNAGNTWDTIAKGRAGFDPFFQQGQYDNALAISPTDTDKIYFGGVTMYSYSPQTGVHRFPDFIYPNAVSGNYMDQFLYAINDKNPEEVYVATDKGVFKSSDAFSNFTSAQFYDHNYGLEGRDFVSIAASKNGRIIGGSDNAQGLLVRNPVNRDFTNLNFGFGYCDFSYLDTNYAFIENYYGDVYESNNNLAAFYSALDTSVDPLTQGGVSRCGGSSVTADAPFIAPLLLHETKSAFQTIDSVAYVATSPQSSGNVVSVTSTTAQTLFPFTLPVSLNAGDTLMVPDPVKSNLFLASLCGVWMKKHALTYINPDWYKISASQASCFAVTKNGNKVYWGTDFGNVASITGLNLAHFTNYNMVDSFQTITNLVSSGRTIESIANDPNNDSILLVTIGGFSTTGQPNVYKSTDAGLTWQSIQVGPAGMPAYTCVIDANNSNNYIVGTEHGIWTSNDAGTTWHQDDANMCDVPVYQLKQILLLSDDCYVLYAATNSRGLWRSYTLTPAGCNTSVGIQDSPLNKPNNFILYPNPATSYTTVEFTIAESQQVIIQLHDITGRLVQTWQQFLSGSNQKVELNTSSLHAGTYLVSVGTGQMQQTKLLVITE